MTSYNHSKLFDELISNTKVVNGCWEWCGWIGPHGYGGSHYLDFEGKKRQYRVHRLVLSCIDGARPSKTLACHHCDNRKCCNPAHLFWGSHKDNAVDMAQKGRNFVLRGEASPLAKLNDTEVLEIRIRLSRFESQKEIARLYSISRQTVSAIKHRQRWKHLL